MHKQLIMLLAFMLAAVGCDQQAAEQAAEDTKAVQAELKHMADAVAKTETSAKLDARKVLADAIADAKMDNKALFVDFSADS